MMELSLWGECFVVRELGRVERKQAGVCSISVYDGPQLTLRVINDHWGGIM